MNFHIILRIETKLLLFFVICIQIKKLLFMLDFLNDKVALEQTYWIIGYRTKPFIQKTKPIISKIITHLCKQKTTKF